MRDSPSSSSAGGVAEASSNSTGGVTLALFSSLKMVVRTTVAKLDKKYEEALPSEDSKTEMEKMKASLTEIDERIKAKKGS